MEEDDIKTRALEFAKKNKDQIARELTDTTKYIPDEVPISVFMAGSPGAGKTEFSKLLINNLEKTVERRVIRIDGDEVRVLMPGYAGNNSHLFQGAVSIIVEKMHDYALKNKQTFVLDGTFSKYEKAVDNIQRSLNKRRSVWIFYLYQKPDVAWKFTEAREEAEGRNIPKLAFIDQFLGARKTIDRIRDEFGDKVHIFLLKRDFERKIVESMVEINQKGRSIDDYIREKYTKEDLENLL